MMSVAEYHAYIRAHADVFPRRILCERTGRSLSSVQRTLAKYGLNRPELKCKAKTPERAEDIIRLWPEHSIADIARRLSICRSIVSRFGRRIGLKRDPEVTRRMRAENIRRNKQARWNRPGAHEEASRRWRLLHRMERLRVESGLPQRTKWRIRTVPRKVYKIREYLKRKYGYYPAEDLLVMLYDEHTRRALPRPHLLHSERFYADTFGFRFLPDYQDDGGNGINGINGNTENNDNQST